VNLSAPAEVRTCVNGKFTIEPKSLKCDEQTCATSYMKNANQLAGGILSCRSSANLTSHLYGSECTISCPTGQSMGKGKLVPTKMLWRCVYLEKPQLANLQSNADATSVSRAVVTARMASATAFASYVPLENGLILFEKHKCTLTACAIPNRTGIKTKVDGSIVLAGQGAPSIGWDLLECSGLVYGSSCTPICLDGYYAGGGLKCGVNGKFIGNVECLPYRCNDAPPTVTSPGTVESGCAGRKHDNAYNAAMGPTRCNITCPATPGGDEYTQQGQKYFTCYKGNWTRPAGDFCTPNSCKYSPQPLFGPSLKNCSGLAHDAKCYMRCNKNYNMPKSAIQAGGFFKCKAGTWQLPGACILEGAVGSTTEVAAITTEILIDLDALFPSDGEDEEVELDYFWAIKNAESITSAIADSLKMSLDNIQIEILDGAGEILNRRLSSSMVHNRRLADAPNNAFRIRVIVLLTEEMLKEKKPQEQIDNIMGLLLGTPTTGANGTKTGGLVGGFRTTLLKQLKKKGIPIPKGLTGVAVKQGAKSVYIPKFVYVVPQWIVSKWSDCSISCTQSESMTVRSLGTHERKVVCSAGGSVCSRKEKKPAEDGTCSETSGCPPEPMIFVGIGVAICCACCACCLNWFRIKQRPPNAGQHKINITVTDNTMDDATDHKAKFTVLRPQFDLDGSTGKGALADDKVTPGSVEDGRTHVIWAIDQPKIESWFDKYSNNPIAETTGSTEADEECPASPANPGGGMAAIMPPDGSAAEGNAQVGNAQGIDRIDLEVASATSTELRALALVPRGFTLEELLGPAPLPPIKPFMEDGEKTEYYSSTHKRWMAGTVIVAPRPGTMADPAPTVVYNVKLGFSQLKQGVGLDLLRRPMDRGELVEIFSKKNGGMWLAAVINGPQVAGATTVGYQVRLNESNDVLEMIPAVRLRLRFPAGQDVLVYQGWEQGWVRGTVDASAPADGLLATSVNVARSEHAIVKVGEIKEEQEQNLLLWKANEEALRLENQDGDGNGVPEVAKDATDDLDIAPWVDVPVLCEGSSEVQRFPSWQLRLRSKWYDSDNQRLRVGV